MTFKEILAEILSARILEREANTPQNETPGFYTAYRAWASSNAKDNPDAKWDNHDPRTIILENHFLHDIDDDNAQDFFNAAQANGITEIIITDTSTALMRTLHALVGAGAELAGLTTAAERPQFYEPRPQPKQGIKLTIPQSQPQTQPQKTRSK